MAPDPGSFFIYVNYDEGVQKVSYTEGNNGPYILSESGDYVNDIGLGATYIFTATLNDGYEIDTVEGADSVTGNVFSISPEDTGSYYITITTKATTTDDTDTETDTDTNTETSEINTLISELITDRTQTDIDNRTEKAYYNVSDYARINEAIQYLSDASEINLGLSTTEITLGQAVTATQFDEILNNISTIRKNWYIAEETPAVPTRLQWDYNKANDIEHILTNSLEFLKSVRIDKLYSGTFRAGSHIKFRGDK